ISGSLKEGLLGDAGNVRVSRIKAGPYEALRNHPEFRDLVIEPAPMLGVPGKRPQTPSASAFNQDTLPHIGPASPEPPKATALTPPTIPTAKAIPSAMLPVIQLDRAATSSEWRKWLFIVVVAIAAGVGGYFLVPFL